MAECPPELPDAGTYLRGLHTAYVVFLGITGTMAVVTLVMYIETVVFFFRNLYNWKPKDKAKWVLAVYPIHILTSFISLMVPRSASVNELIAACYFSVCVYQFVTMLVGHYGGARRMANKLQKQTITLDTGPCCCCCKCLPTGKMTSHNIHSVQTLVIQYAVAGPILAYCMAIVWSNAHYDDPFKDPASYMSMVNTVSSLVAAWGMSVTFRLAEPFLLHAHIKPKFLCVQLINFFTNIQSFLIEILVMSGVIKCDHQLNAASVGLRYHNIILIFEMFALWMVARYYYRRDIKDIPVEDQVYVDTHNVGTSISGSLDRTRTSDYQMFGPTSAQELLDQDWKRLSLERMAAGIILDPSAGGDSRTLGHLSPVDAKIAKKQKGKSKNSAYEPVEFKLPSKNNNKQKADAGVGPDDPPAPGYEPSYAKNNTYPGNNRTSAMTDTNVMTTATPAHIDVDFPTDIKNSSKSRGLLGPQYGPPESNKEQEVQGGQAPGVVKVPKPVRQRGSKNRRGTDTASETGSSMDGSVLDQEYHGGGRQAGDILMRESLRSNGPRNSNA